MEELVDGFKPALAPPPPRSVGPRLSELWSFPGAAVSIGDDVWIGANCSVLKGARIGDGCIVATGSVVTRGEYPANSILAGNPARVIKTIGQGSAEVPARKAVQETTS
jgi:serine acetyltransferase